MQSLKRSADEAGLSIEEKRKRILALVDAEQRAEVQANAERNLELAKMAKAKAAAEEAAEQERKRKEELEKTKRLHEALDKSIAELEERALIRKAEAMGLPTTDLTVNKGTRYEETHKVVWPFVGLLANGDPIDRMDMIEKVEGFLSADESCKGMWGRLGSLGSQLYTFQYGKVNGNWVLRVMYDSYVPDCNDEGPHDDDQSDRGENSYFAYFDVDMYGRVDDFDAITDDDVEALDESNEWVTIHSD